MIDTINNDFIYHYTNIPTLALILKNRNIRFNRLDKVDDVSEMESFKRLNLAKFLFVSCWTYDPIESIPLWNMYTDRMAGVRISLPINFFNYQPLETSEETLKKLRMEVEEGILSPIPFDRIFDDEYIISPNFFNNIDKFHVKVEYVEDYEERKNSFIEFLNPPDTNQLPTIRINEFQLMASLKDPAWSFQKELRFVLFIIPHKKDLPLKNLVEFQKEQIINGNGPNLDYFDVDINPDILREIQITTGPGCSDSELIMIESLLDKYAPSGKISKSKFHGTIRT